MKTINYTEASKIFANTAANTGKIYKIYNIIDLGGNSLTLPSACILDFQGGYFTNGTLVGNNTTVITPSDFSDVIQCLINGSFKKDGEEINIINQGFSGITVGCKYIDSQSAFEEFITFLKAQNSATTVNATLASNKRFYHNTYDSTNIWCKTYLYGGENTIIDCAKNVYSANEAYDATPTHYICKIKSAISPFTAFADENDNLVPMSEESDAGSRMITSLNEVDDSGITRNPDGSYYNKGVGGKIKIPIVTGYEYLKGQNSFNDVYGWLNCAWQTVFFTVESSDTTNLNCIVLTKIDTDDINYDNSTYHNALNYVIYNVQPQEGKVYYDNQSEDIYIPKTVKELKVIDQNVTQSFTSNSKNSFEFRNEVYISNITFVNSPLVMTVHAAANDSYIENCKFINITGQGIHHYDTDETTTLYIKNCYFKDCGLNSGCPIFSSNDWGGHATTGYVPTDRSNYDSNIWIEGCTVTKSDILYYKTGRSGIYVNNNAVVKNNKVSNQSNCHIFTKYGAITVEGNEVFNTTGFNSYPLRNFLIDLGAIYVAYLSYDNKFVQDNTYHKVGISYNKIYNIAGGYMSREYFGIYIDDGRGDVTAEYNVVLDTSEWSIFSRDIGVNPSTSGFTQSSIRNVLRGNVVTSPYLLKQGSEVSSANMPVTDSNILLTTRNPEVGAQYYDNVNNWNDLQVFEYVINGCNVSLPFDVMELNTRILTGVRKVVHLDYRLKVLAGNYGDMPMKINGTIGNGFSWFHTALHKPVWLDGYNGWKEADSAPIGVSRWGSMSQCLNIDTTKLYPGFRFVLIDTIDGESINKPIYFDTSVYNARAWKDEKGYSVFMHNGSDFEYIHTKGLKEDRPGYLPTGANETYMDGFAYNCTDEHRYIYYFNDSGTAKWFYADGTQVTFSN